MRNRQECKKFFFFDIDGTLVPYTGERVMPESARKAIRELRDRGHFCAIATGRPQYMVIRQARNLGFDDFVSDGGNGITLNGKLISLDSMPIEQCALLADQCDKNGYPWAASLENRHERRTKYPAFRDMLSTSMKDVFQPDLDLRKCTSIYKMFITCMSGEEKNLPVLHQMNWQRLVPESILVEPGNKEIGIRKIMDYYKAPYQDVVVFGDNINDLSMFQPEWTNIAMGNAIPGLKEKADFVTLDSDDGGIAYALRHYGWID